MSRREGARDPTRHKCPPVRPRPGECRRKYPDADVRSPIRGADRKTPWTGRRSVPLDQSGVDEVRGRGAAPARRREARGQGSLPSSGFRYPASWVAVQHVRRRFVRRPSEFQTLENRRSPSLVYRRGARRCLRHPGLAGGASYKDGRLEERQPDNKATRKEGDGSFSSWRDRSIRDMGRGAFRQGAGPTGADDRHTVNRGDTP